MSDQPTDESAVTHTRDVVEGRAARDARLRTELEAMVRQHWKRVWSVCYRTVRDPELASELTQDALMTACRKLPDFDERSSLSTWVCGIARNLARNKVRERKDLLTEEGIVDGIESATVMRSLSAAERIHLVRAAAATVLSGEEQDAINLRYAENLPYEAIAGELGVEGGANRVRVILQTATRRLRPELARRLEQLGHGLSFVRTSDRTEER